MSARLIQVFEVTAASGLGIGVPASGSVSDPASSRQASEDSSNVLVAIAAPNNHAFMTHSSGTCPSAQCP
jgi:hypothetical protein